MKFPAHNPCVSKCARTAQDCDSEAPIWCQVLRPHAPAHGRYVNAVWKAIAQAPKTFERSLDRSLLPCEVWLPYSYRTATNATKGRAVDASIPPQCGVATAFCHIRLVSGVRWLPHSHPIPRRRAGHDEHPTTFPIER